MARNKGVKFYGVRIGRDGPNVYSTWNECEKAVLGFPGAVHKSFPTRADAENWVEEGRVAGVTNINAISSMPGSYEADSDYYDCEEGDAPYFSYEDNLLGAARAIDGSTVIDSKLIPSSLTFTQNQLDKPEESPSKCERIESISLPLEPEILKMKLSYTQQQVFEKVKRGENVFFTGSAGTGKSVLLRELINYFGGPSSSLAVTASTGIAGVNIGGTTLHSFAGIGLGKESASVMTIKIKKNMGFVWQRWKKVKRLIIDEVSMLDGSLFDKLETLAKNLRGNDLPFGGIQLILSGDFCQLPPVPDRHDGVTLPITFAFDAESWSRCIGEPIILSQVFRQRDHKFVTLLNGMRFGKLNEEAVKEVNNLKRPVVYDDGIEPTELFPLRAEVEAANKQRLDRLQDPTHVYLSDDRPGMDIRGNVITKVAMEKLLERLVVPKEIALKVGAQVMLVKNLEQGRLVNGSLGKVVDFRTTLVAVQMGTQISLDDKDGKDPIAKKLGIDHDTKIRMSTTMGDASENSLGEGAGDALYRKDRVWPVVKFTNGRELLCVPADFSVVSASGETEAAREQVPLILAWALSVHKSQGQTLERVKVNLRRTFEKGQAYVALSRATSMERLQVLNFDRTKVMAHPRVIQFYNNLQDEADRAEERRILEEMDNEDAIKAFFEDDYADVSF